MLTLEDIRYYCASKKGTREDFPFDFTTLVFKVGPKMYGLTSIESDGLFINLKCDPRLSLELRSRFVAVKPGYHMNKKHWNTVIIDGTIPDEDIFRMIDHSYDLVYRKLPRRVRDELESRHQENGS